MSQTQLQDDVDRRLLYLMGEYHKSEVDKIAPHRRSPLNVHQLSFYGFYRWLEKRKQNEHGD